MGWCEPIHSITKQSDDYFDAVPPLFVREISENNYDVDSNV